MDSCPGCAIPKALKMELVALLLTLALKRVVLGRYKSKVSIRYLLCRKIAHELLSVKIISNVK